MAAQTKHFGVFALNRFPISFGEFNIKFARVLSNRWTATALLVFAIIQQAVGHQNTDNSWLFTVAEHVLAGARPYVDIIETNPPASFLIYMPAAMFAQAIGAPTEAIAVVFVFLNAMVCAWLAWRVLREAGIVAQAESGFAAVAASFILLVMPGFVFAQREHLAVIWSLPVLAVYAARYLRRPAGLAVRAGGRRSRGLRRLHQAAFCPCFRLSAGGMPDRAAFVQARLGYREPGGGRNGFGLRRGHFLSFPGIFRHAASDDRRLCAAESIVAGIAGRTLVYLECRAARHNRLCRTRPLLHAARIYAYRRLTGIPRYLPRAGQRLGQPRTSRGDAALPRIGAVVRADDYREWAPAKRRQPGTSRRRWVSCTAFCRCLPSPSWCSAHPMIQPAPRNTLGLPPPYGAMLRIIRA